MKQLDSVFTLKEKEYKNGIEILKHASSVKMLLKADSLLTTSWSVFRVNRNTYDEMLISGSFYSFKNKELQEAIRTHFIEANVYEKAFQEINANGQDIFTIIKHYT